MRSAIHVKGDSLVLMDGETFAEISKKILLQKQEEKHDRQHIRKHRHQRRKCNRPSVRNINGPLQSGGRRHTRAGYEVRLSHLHPEIPHSVQTGPEYIRNSTI